MPSNKPRLMLALYARNARPEHRHSPHYALIMTPKPTASDTQLSLPGTKFHALNTLQVVSGAATQPWRVERAKIANLDEERRLLACIVIAKVVDEVGVKKLLATVPVYQLDDPDQVKAKNFDCVAWVHDAVDRLRASGAVTSLAWFDKVERGALLYMERKQQEGRWGEHWRPGVPVFDLLQGQAGRELYA